MKVKSTYYIPSELHLRVDKHLRKKYDNIKRSSHGSKSKLIELLLLAWCIREEIGGKTQMELTKSFLRELKAAAAVSMEAAPDVNMKKHFATLASVAGVLAETAPDDVPKLTAPETSEELHDVEHVETEKPDVVGYEEEVDDAGSEEYEDDDDEDDEEN